MPRAAAAVRCTGVIAMDPLISGPDAAEEWLDNWSADVQERAEQARTFADRVAELSATATDSDGAVQVTVNASGGVTGLRLSDRIRSWPAERTAGRILAVMRAAQAQLAGRVAAVAAQTVGEHSPIGRDVVAGFHTRFPAPPERKTGQQI
jgi:hypothetical protein